LIDEQHIGLVWRFGITSGRDVDKFRGLAIHTGLSGSPILSGALAWLDCRVEARMGFGDRTLYLAEVLDSRWDVKKAPLTLKRLLELAPADKLQEMQLALQHDIELDRSAILEWRRQQADDGLS
jgi:hypothetical protein